MNGCVVDPPVYLAARPGDKNLIVVARLFAVLLAVLLCALPSEAVTDSQRLGAYTILLIGYLYFEINNLRMNGARFLWINPVVLASVFAYMLPFGVTNVIYFMPDDVVAPVGLPTGATPWMNQLMFLVVFGVCAMWVGYSSGVGRSMGRMLERNWILRKWLAGSGSVSETLIYGCLATSLAARLLMIKLGVFGYSSTYDNIVAYQAVDMYLDTAAVLGQLALAFVAMTTYSLSRAVFRDMKKLLWLVLVFEVLFGFLVGFKSAVVMPFMIVGFVYYSQRGRFPRWFVPAVVASLIGAYAVIEPFRFIRNMDAEFSETSVINIASALIKGNQMKVGDIAGGAPTWLQVLARANATYFASLGIEYAANNELPPDSPKFMKNLILSPAYAVIPRFLWRSKPLKDDGLWYTHEVLRKNIYSSTAMSPFTYLNFAGGILAVIIGFFIVGMLQRGFFDGLRSHGNRGLIVFLGLLPILAIVNNSFDMFSVSIIRALPLLIIVQYVIFSRSPESCER